MPQAAVIDSFRFAREAMELRGVLGMRQLPRLAQMQCSTEALQFTLRGGIGDNGKPFLQVIADGTVSLACQRCLQPLAIPLALDVVLELAATIEEIDTADDDVDRVLGSNRMDVAALIEDEVILELPMAPKHADCAPVSTATAGAPLPLQALSLSSRDGR